MGISSIVMGWRWRLFEPWWRLIPQNTRCNRRQPTSGEGRYLLDVKGPDCWKVNLYRWMVESIGKMTAETDEHVFTGWKSWSRRRKAIFLSTDIQEAALGRSTNFPSRRGKTLSQVEEAFIWQRSSKSERSCCGFWVGMESAWEASLPKRWNWKWDGKSAIGLDLPQWKRRSDELPIGTDRDPRTWC